MKANKKIATKVLARLKYYHVCTDQLKKLHAGYFEALMYIGNEADFDFTEYYGDEWLKICELVRTFSIPQIEKLNNILKNK